jgi:chaperonin GroES
VLENGKVRALDVKILFGKYAGNEIQVEGVEHLILREDEILGVVEK